MNQRRSYNYVAVPGCNTCNIRGADWGILHEITQFCVRSTIARWERHGDDWRRTTITCHGDSATANTAYLLTHLRCQHFLWATVHKV